jgi:hypothetical protein
VRSPQDAVVTFVQPLGILRQRRDIPRASQLPPGLCFATTAMTPARPRWRVLWCLAPLLPGLSFGDQAQLREDAVLAADEQAGARGRAAFGRHRHRELCDGAPSKALVSRRVHARLLMGDTGS